MKGAENNSREDLQWLEKYRKEKKIVSEEYLYFLADQFTVSCDWTQARKLAEELEKKFSQWSCRGASSAGSESGKVRKQWMILKRRSHLAGGFPWAADPELERQMPYVRKNPKIGPQRSLSLRKRKKIQTLLRKIGAEKSRKKKGMLKAIFILL